MKILFTGGGSGGHFDPIIAVAEEVHTVVRERKLLDPELFYMSDDPFSTRMLFDTRISFKKTSAGKMRTYRSIFNFFDLFRTAWGIIRSFFSVGAMYPDVVFGKGGYASFPALFAARFFRIPVIIHESDSVPGRVNSWAGKFATRIAVSYPQAATFFPADKVALTGNPVRKAISRPLSNGAHEFLALSESLPVVLVLGGSQGSEIINESVISILPELLTRYQVIHQTGKKNLQAVVESAAVVLGESKFKDRYKPFDYLNDLALSMSAGVASIVVSRAGSAIFEIARWGTPSVIIPISESNGDHQRKNAFNYSRTGAAIVIEEANLTPHVLLSEIDRVLGDSALREDMKKSAIQFSSPDAAKKIAEEIVNIALAHEK